MRRQKGTAFELEQARAAVQREREAVAARRREAGQRLAASRQAREGQERTWPDGWYKTPDGVEVRVIAGQAYADKLAPLPVKAGGDVLRRWAIKPVCLGLAATVLKGKSVAPEKSGEAVHSDILGLAEARVSNAGAKVAPQGVPPSPVGFDTGGRPVLNIPVDALQPNESITAARERLQAQGLHASRSTVARRLAQARQHRREA